MSMFFCMRLMVLRLHDVNLSGKWLLGLILAIGLGGAVGKEYFVMAASVMFWSGSAPKRTWRWPYRRATRHRWPGSTSSFDRSP
ncbi:hypothetical protein RBA41_21595 [Massilia sp. CCM 9210]|uniref:hypothetical protein n=1 Tax=Massilia scottii TaxID=3057166 RepID=UPI00279692F0|nr:hypothetical protein [Massilia sp. CCM 9210]MDQ1815894.1 hypothetical protein [Massilia sp. CCM 9210]